MKDKLSSKAEGVLVREAERLQGILAELGAPHHRYKMTLPAPALLGERMWVAGESSAAYSRYEDFVEDTVPFLRREMELMLAAENPPTVLQIDDPHLCLFVDDDVRAKYPDAEAAAAFAVAKNNALVEGLVRNPPLPAAPILLAAVMTFRVPSASGAWRHDHRGPPVPSRRRQGARRALL